jgi:CRP-like cAMP-binding protein
MYGRAARKVLFLVEQNEAFKSSIIPLLMFRYSAPHEYVYFKGDYADEMYFVAKGSILFIEDHIVFRVVRDGSHFGELELMDHIPR